MQDIFDFSFQNVDGLLLALIPGLISLSTIGYIFFYLPRNRSIDIFLILTLSFFLWQINDALARISITAETADKWDCILSVAWIFIGPLTLHFTLLFCKIIKQGHSRMYYVLLYLPAFFFMGTYQAHIYPHVFRYSALWGWVNYHDDVILDQVMVYWISLLVLSATVLLIRNTYKVRADKLKMYQSLLITVGIAVPATSGIITQVVFPEFLGLNSIPVTSTSMTFFSIATVVALKKYKLFDATELLLNEKLVEAVPVIVISISDTYRVTFINRYGSAGLGVEYTTFNNLQIDDVIVTADEQDKSKLLSICDQALSGKYVKDIELTCFAQNSEMIILLSANPIVNNNRVVGALLSARDITEIKRSEQKLIHNEALLNEAQRIAKMGSWEWDIVNDRISWSDNMYNVLRFEKRDTDVSYATFIGCVHEDDREDVEAIIKTAYKTHEDFRFFHRIHCPDEDEDIIVYGQGKVTVNADGEAIRMNGTGQDVTENRKNEALLLAQNSELQKVNTELDKFVYSVSHDLRSPLTSMLGIILIAEKETTDTTFLSYLSLLKEGAQKLDKFILDILDFSRNARTPVEPVAVDVERLVNGIIQNHKYMDNAEKIRFSIEVEQGLTVMSDIERLSIILNNLVSNAIRYSDPAKDDPYIKVVAVSAGTGVQIDIEDNGSGISQSDQAKVFEMFYRGANSTSGSGVGLYIVKESVQKINGTITLSSETGIGSKFSVNVPAMQ